MSLDGGITHLASWGGNTIMPTLSGLFFAGAVYRYKQGRRLRTVSLRRLRRTDVLGHPAHGRGLCDPCRAY
jgi:hypothetical protein